MTQRYDESSIDILEGLEPVRLRPGQFTRTDSPLHVLQEVVDNAVDEALAGHATRIAVRLWTDGSISVKDNGRGIPTGSHKDRKIPVIQAVFGVLYAGGKFKKGEGAYSFSGGLHGVGVSVTNALADWLEATVWRAGRVWTLRFEHGEVARPLARQAECGDETGTEVRFKPEARYFDSPDVPLDALRELLRTKAVLLPGLHVDLQTADAAAPESFHYANGLPDYLREINRDHGLLTPVVEDANRFEEGNAEGFAAGEGGDWALCWFDGAPSSRSFVNLIPTPEHGTHVAGLRSAALIAVRDYAEHLALLPKGVRLTADDVCKTLGFVLSVRMLDPSFDNQTKDRLNSRDGAKLMEKSVLPRLQGWLNRNTASAKTVVEAAIRNALARERSALKQVRKKSSSVVLLPGKLSDCESEDTSRNELFLVEGDSAGGSAKMARDKEYQAILPLRGKGQNVWERTAVQALENKEVSDIAQALGVEPGGPDLARLRYGKLCILSDADVDGYHIQVLLITLFLKHFPTLVEQGRVYVAKPPLFRLDVEAAGKKRPARKLYAMDQDEMDALERKLKVEGYSIWKTGRFKGLGEMDPPELWDTTLNPDTRRLLTLSVPDAERARVTFENLMGRTQASWRRAWMERRGHEVESD